jgi:CheY-like chemotaxis protein
MTVINEMDDVLVADDNALLVSVLGEIFRESGYSVRTAPDGFVALAMIRDRIPDILISDLNMPRMSGFELLSVVRRRFPRIAVIAMSGAYAGAIIPQGVPADAFYPKGERSVAELFEMLCAIKDDATRYSARAAAPIWVPALPIGEDHFSVMAIACPECMRTFYHCLHDAELLRAERSCPHCLHPVQLAIVRTSVETDNSGLPFASVASTDSAPRAYGKYSGTIVHGALR